MIDELNKFVDELDNKIKKGHTSINIKVVKNKLKSILDAPFHYRKVIQPKIREFYHEDEPAGNRKDSDINLNEQ